MEFYESIEPESASCDFNEIEDAVMIVSENKFRREIDEMKKTPTDKKKYVDLPLVDREGKVGSRSGLNWGQRPNRDPNQAYIPIPASIGRKNFFPPKGTVFTVMTDDGFVFQCVTAQNEKGRVPKAIETSNDNSELGAYFRRRLEVGSGEVVKTEDLDRYGRKTVTFIDLGDGSYYMDFSIPRGHNENLS